MKITWNEFKTIVSKQCEEQDCFIYRGQSNSNWLLRSTLRRTSIVKSDSDFIGYINYVLPLIQDPVEAWTDRSWNLADHLGLAEFLAFLQHNGFPTPLLDWTFSPYIAAYFAFEGINHFSPQSDEVAIYAFNQKAWTMKFKQIYDISVPDAHVSILRPRTIGNHKLSLQQGLFLWSNIEKVEEHIKANESVSSEFLNKYIINIQERPKIIKELSLMGVTAVQLMPSVESVCKKALEDLIGLQPIEK